LAAVLSRDEGADGQPDLLSRLLNQWKLRREHTPHESLRVDFVARTPQGDEPQFNEEMRSYFQHAMKFHSQRKT
jgi:hypothetical protein